MTGEELTEKIREVMKMKCEKQTLELMRMTDMQRKEYMILRIYKRK